MTDSKEVEESSKADSVAKTDELSESHLMKEVDMSGENCKDEREEIEEEEDEGEEDEEEEEEEEEGEQEEDAEEVEEEEEEEGEEEEEDVEEEGEEDETEESEEDEEDEQEQKRKPTSAYVSDDGTGELLMEASVEKNSDKNMESPIDAGENGNDVNARNKVSNVDGGVLSEVHAHADSPVPEISLKNNLESDHPPVNDENGPGNPEAEQANGAKLDAYDSPNSQDVDGKINSRSLRGGVAPSNRSSLLKQEDMKEEEPRNELRVTEGTIDAENRNLGSFCIFDSDTSGGGESGTDDEQAAFTYELEKFHKERSLEFKPPKFYGEPLNLLKLWRAVMKLGGYDKVTACKYWRQVGESFKPPKTCTTVSWTFRIFYEKALLEYERYRTATGDGPSVPASLPVPMSAENQASGSGRARRDAAARAMQGWHSQRILDNGEVSDPIIKDKNANSLSKKEKQLKNLGVLKRKKPSSTDVAVKAARTKIPKAQSETTVIDIGSPADWVKINVRETKDCYEVYALVPGLLREETSCVADGPQLFAGIFHACFWIMDRFMGKRPSFNDNMFFEVRVQSDPAGRLVISGEPENPDNPWNVTPFKKVVSLPSRIDPHQTSAVVTLHGQLFVRVPFEQYD